MEGLFRRGGIWWARLAVPVRLRALAGRREFVMSTGTSELAVGKLVAATLLAGWRKNLHRLEGKTVDDKSLLKLVEGSPELLVGGGYVSIAEAVNFTGLPAEALIRAVKAERLGLFCQLGQIDGDGYLIDVQHLELVDPAQGVAGGYVIPAVRPDLSVAANFKGRILRVPDAVEVAGAIDAERLNAPVDLVALEAPGRPGTLFCPSVTVQRDVLDLQLDTAQVEALRLTAARLVTPERIERARVSAVTSASGASTSAAGKWASKKFSEALDSYSTDTDGMPGAITDPHEIRQRKGQMMVFIEFMGDLKLGEIDGDVLRAYRDGPLRTIPGSTNHLPKSIRRPSMKETIEALRADGRDWPLLSDEMRAQRMQHLYGLFDWLDRKKYLVPNPAASLRGETGMTKAEMKERSRRAETPGRVRGAADEEDEEGRRPFSRAELEAIFTQQEFQTGHGGHVDWSKGEWYPFQYWLPLLGLLAGVRIREGSQLHLSDVRMVDGFWCIDINENTADKSLKNKPSKRIIPVPRQLIELGFLAYCDQLRGKGFRRVFPELTWAKSPAKYGKEPGRRMTNMLAALGMPRDGTLVFHCLRHNCNNALLRAPVGSMAGGEYLRNLIALRVLGHAVGDSVNLKHYLDITISEMNQLMDARQLGLPKIASFDIAFGLECVAIGIHRKLGYRHDKEDMGPLGVFSPGGST
jgi:integrase